ncbi:MAG: TolC family protein [Gammaproteobacteria bacterium]|jgi:NodT family efflux transporter outer membrane factor (OMF) lipoprotein
MQAPRVGLNLVLVVALVGCGGAPTQEQVEQDVDQALKSQPPTMPEQWGTVVESGTVQAGWIESFNDPALTALVIEAQKNNRDLLAAATNVDRAYSLARQAGAALKPEVSLAVTGTRSGSVDSSVAGATNLGLGAQVSWEADVWGRLRSGERAAVASAQAVEADFRSAQQSLAAATAKAYFTAIEANIQVGIASETLEILRETNRIVNVKYNNGLATGQDVSLARSDLATARERLTEVEGSYRDAVRALEVLLGRYPGADLEIREALPDVPPPPPAGLPSELLERRPDIVAAERRVAAAFNATEQARAARLPTLGLTGSLGGASGSLSNLLDPANVAWSVGANLLAPLYDGGRRREAVNITTAEQEQALAAYGQAAINAFTELETSLDQGVVLSQRLDELREAAAQAEKAFRIATLRYEEGEEDLLSVQTIQQRVINAKSTRSSVERLLLEQRVNLNLALGGSWYD